MSIHHLLFFLTTTLLLSSFALGGKQAYILPYCSKLTVEPYNVKITTTSTTLTFKSTSDLWFMLDSTYFALNPNNQDHGKFSDFARYCVCLTDTSTSYTYFPPVNSMNLTSSKSFTATFTSLPNNKRFSLTMASCFWSMYRESEYHQELVPLPPISIYNYATGTGTVASYSPSYDYDTYYAKYCLSKATNTSRFSSETFSSTISSNYLTISNSVTPIADLSTNFVKSYSNSILSISGKWKTDSFSSQISSFTYSNYDYQLANPINMILKKNLTSIKYPLKWKRHINVASEATSFSVPSDTSITKRCADPAELQYLIEYYIGNNLIFTVNDVEGGTPWVYGSNPSSPAEVTDAYVLVTYAYYEAVFYSGLATPYSRALIVNGILTIARTDISSSYFYCAKGTMRNQFQYWESTVYHNIRYSTIHNMYSFDSTRKTYNLNAMADIEIGSQSLQLTNFENRNSSSVTGITLQISDTSLDDSFYSQTRVVPIFQYNETINSIYDMTFIYDSELGSKTGGALVTQEDFVTAYKSTICADKFSSKLDTQLSNFFTSSPYTFIRLPEFSNRLNYSNSISYDSLTNSIQMNYLNYGQSIQYNLQVDSALLVYKEAKILLEDVSFSVIPNRQEWNEMNATLSLNITNSGDIKGNYQVSVTCSEPLTFKEENVKIVSIGNGESSLIQYEVTNSDWKSFYDIRNISCQVNVLILKEELWTNANKEITVDETIVLDHGYFVPYCEQKFNEPFIEFIENHLNQSIFIRDSNKFYNSIKFTVNSNTTDQISARYNISVLPLQDNPFILLNTSQTLFTIIPQEQLTLNLEIVGVDFEKIMRDRLLLRNYTFEIKIQNMDTADCWSEIGKSINQQFSFHVEYECPENFVGDLCEIPVCYGINATDLGNVCSGHGSCLSPDKCQCVDGYVADICSIPICFEYNSTDARVCSGHGECLSPDYCQCISEYTGEECNIPICYGIPANNVTTCYGNGNCTQPDACICEEGFTSGNCSIPICFGLNASYSQVCSSHGQCINPNECQCNNGYTGLNCSVPICFGIHSLMNDSSFICSSHGHCIDTDTCLCNDGYYGPECQLHNCFHVQFNDSNVCYGHGNCTSPDTCHCQEGYVSDNCSIPVCFGHNATDTNVCSGNGECLSPNNCMCSSEFTGSMCEIPICFGIPANNASTCYGNGNCTQPDNCQCIDGFTSGNCSIPICFNINASDFSVCSTHGSCISPDNCKCVDGYTGMNCSIPICFGIHILMNDSSSICSAHGHCIDTDTCLCNDGYYGPECELHNCFHVQFNDSNVCYGHGECIAPDYCECLSGFTSHNCSLPVCYQINSSDVTHVCSGHGQCLTPNECTCTNEFTGIICEIPICYGIPANESTVCVGHGNCTDTDTCHCQEGYVSDNCSIPVCFGFNSSDISNVCSGHGQCLTPNNCQCSVEYTGSMCDIPICFGVSANNQTTCFGNGNCTEPDTCICEGGFTSGNCSIPICFGLNASYSQVCSSHGQCINPNECQCHEGYTGVNCSIPICFGIHILMNESETICSSHGHCIDTDTCSCNDGYYGPKCELHNCFHVQFNDSRTCSGHGNCTSPDTCQCNEGYVSDNCSIPVCFDFNSTNPSVCSGNGICVAFDTCSCHSPYYGNNCSLFDCYDIEHLNSTSCSSHGECSSPNNCTCQDGYYGSMCDLHNCFGILYNDSVRVCSGHGICLSPDTCLCSNGYVSDNCSIPICFGYNSTDPTVCSGHGQCNSPNQCTCSSDYTGEICEIPLCFGIPATNESVCDGHGNCSYPNYCKCKDGFTSGNCSTPICYGVNAFEVNVCSGHGECIYPELCKCSDGYTFENCSIPICFGVNVLMNDTKVCSGHGRCVEWDKCECEEGYFGDECELFECFEFLHNESSVCSGNGVCRAPNECKCDVNYFGSNCEVTSCFGIVSNSSKVCSGFGNCTVFDTCECDSKHTGENCSITFCFGQLSNSSKVCSGNGSCLEYNSCNCSQGYYGESCELFDCYNFEKNSSQVCSGKGKCIDSNNCLCHLGYFGESCQDFECFGIHKDDPNVCSHISPCTSPNNCSCPSGYYGASCELFDCFDIPSNYSNVCSSQGKCSLPNNCTCEEGYYGYDCSQFDCFSINKNNESVCSSNGKCQTFNNCSCFDNYYGERCELFQCFGEEYNSSQVCHGRGECLDYNYCKCHEGYLGEACQDFSCFGIHFNESNRVCSGNGSCVSLNNCSCFEGFSGEACDVKIVIEIPERNETNNGTNVWTNQTISSNSSILDSNINNGTNSSSTNQTEIWANQTETLNTASFTNQTFLNQTLNESNNTSTNETEISNSTNIESNQTISNQTSLNSTTEFKTNQTISQNDTNISNSTSALTENCPLFKGQSCSGHGICNHSQCYCDNGYSGYSCNLFECFGINSSDLTACSGNGHCESPDHCICDLGFSSPNCSLFTCFDKSNLDPHVCYGNGKCQKPNLCECNAEFYGAECELFKCYSILSNESNVCHYHGICTHHDNCQCDVGYQGLECNIPICFNISSANISNVCSGHGKCVDYNNCQCENGYLGEECQFTSCNKSSCINGVCENALDCKCNDGYGGINCEQVICFEILASDSNVCNGNGKCISPYKCNCTSLKYSGDKCQYEQDSDELCSIYGELTVFNSNWMSESLRIELNGNLNQTLKSFIRYSSNLFSMNSFKYPITIQNNGVRSFEYSVRSYCENGKSFKSLGNMVHSIESSKQLSQNDIIQIDNDAFGFVFYSLDERFENIECHIELNLKPVDRMDNCLIYDSKEIPSSSITYNFLILFENVDSCLFIKESETPLEETIQNSVLSSLTNQSSEVYNTETNSTESYLKILSIFPQKRNNWQILQSTNEDNTTTSISAVLLITAQLSNPENLFGIFTPALYCQDEIFSSGETFKSSTSLKLYHEMPKLTFQFNVTIQNVSQDLIDYGRVRGGKEGTASVNIDSMNLNCTLVLLPSPSKCWTSDNSNSKRSLKEELSQLQTYLESLKKLICHFTLPIVSGEFKFVQSVRNFEIGVVALTYTCMTLGFASMICTTKGPRDRKHSLLQLADFVKQTRRNKLEHENELDETLFETKDLPYCENCGHKTLKRAKYEIHFDSSQLPDHGFHVCEQQACFEALSSLYNENYCEYFTCYDCESGQLVDLPPFLLESVDQTDLPEAESQILMDSFEDDNEEIQENFHTVLL